ncbi:MAG: bifunctional oligoribonuclease/PAP phosphatase NrnA [Bacilli bacterium]|nr:bifunctional oligoribonuclease/PAP phosphatase NrnA [Bacilli bacterium]
MYKELIEKIKEYNTIVIARHIGVDPDALCSQLALRDAIQLTYPEKKVLAVGTGSQRFLSIGKLDRLEKVENALLIICDTPDQKRIDSINFEDYSFSIKIDHHPFMQEFCNLEYIEDTATSTCEIIMKILEETELQCNSSIAELLYIGLVSDSNRFLFSSCTSDTFKRIASYIEKYPFNLEKAYEKLYFRPLNEVRLEGYIALNMKTTENGLGYVMIKDDVISSLGVDSASAGNMINNFNYIKEVIVWVTISEDIKNNQFRLSIRSRGPEINRLLEKYNGGGHKYAAGARVKTEEEAMQIISDMDQELAKYKERISEGK